MAFVPGSLFLACRSRLDSTSAAVVAHSNIFSYIHSFLVHVANLCSVHVPHRGVIEEVSSLPAPTGKTAAEVTEPIINSPIEPHHRSPIPCVENKSRTAPTPVRRSPEVTDFRRENPRAWHPVVIVSVPSPIAGSPDITVPRTNRLLIHRQFRRCNRDGNNDLRGSRTGDESHRHS